MSVSCARSVPVGFPVLSADGSIVSLKAYGQAAAEGVLRLDRAGSLRYRAESAISVAPVGALEVEYETDAFPAGSLVIFSADGQPSWSLPSDLSLQGLPPENMRVIRYRFPVSGASLSVFRISVQFDKANAQPAGASVPPPTFRLKEIRAAPRAYGFSVEEDAALLTPFVYRETTPDSFRWTIDPTPEFRPADSLRVALNAPSSSGVLTANGTGYRYFGSPDVGTDSVLTFSPGALPAESFPLSWESKTIPRILLADAAPRFAFPDVPVTADPGLVLAYRREAWRDPRYEVFSWERFPSILIFDTADYAVQDRLFKRLAFFVEKAGFRGALAADGDISSLHGWNAHDYRAEDLAEFYETARKTRFPLNAEERELEGILLANGILRTSKGDASGRVFAGNGAVVSISRESEGYLRTLFMNHEAYHGLFFQDEAFRRFSSQRWTALDPEAKRFLKAYFDSRRYEVKDDYLMTNELMAYCLQQPLELAPRYFGNILAGRLEKDPKRKSVLPERVEGEIPYPELANEFRRVAGEFDSYVFGRWGTRAGRVVLVHQISRTNASR